MAGLTLALASSPPVVFFIQVSLSEYPTWIFLPLLFPLLFLSRSPREWLRGAVLASLSCLTRLNQIPPLLAVMAVFAWRAWRIRLRPDAGRGRPGARDAVAAGRAQPLLWRAARVDHREPGRARQHRPPASGASAILRRFRASGLASGTRSTTCSICTTLRDKFPRGEYVSWVGDPRDPAPVAGRRASWTLARRAAPAITKVAPGPAAGLSRRAPRLRRGLLLPPAHHRRDTSRWAWSPCTPSGAASAGASAG